MIRRCCQSSPLWLALAFAACQEPGGAAGGEESAATDASPVAAARVSSPPARPTAQEYVAVVAASSSVDLTTEEAARIERVFVSMGAPVKAGDPIAQLDVQSLREQLATARASLSAARAASRKARVGVSDARREFDLERKLAREGISPTAKVAQARAVVAQSRASRSEASALAERARSEVSHLERLIADSTLRAPIDGVVSLLRVRAGDRIAAGESLVRILAPGEVKLRFAVPASDAAGLQPGARVLFLPAGAAAGGGNDPPPLLATVRQVAPDLEPPLQLVVAEAEFDGASRAAELRAGSVGRVNLAPDVATTPGAR